MVSQSVSSQRTEKALLEADNIDLGRPKTPRRSVKGQEAVVTLDWNSFLDWNKATGVM